jgi:hypothetical protein
MGMFYQESRRYIHSHAIILKKVDQFFRSGSLRKNCALSSFFPLNGRLISRRNDTGLGIFFNLLLNLRNLPNKRSYSWIAS